MKHLHFPSLRSGPSPDRRCPAAARLFGPSSALGACARGPAHMAPVQIAGAPRRGKTPQWTPESVITEIQHFVQAHGEVPRLADLNPGQAKITGQVWRIDRYRAGCPVCGSAYPSANAARRCFDGSLERAIRAAGFEPAKRGPRRRTEVDLTRRARPRAWSTTRAWRSTPRWRAPPTPRRAPSGCRPSSTVPAPARPRRRRSRRRSSASASPTPPRWPACSAAREAAEARAATLKSELAEARMDAAEARRTAVKLASRLERAEATVTEARAAEARGRRRAGRRAGRRRARARRARPTPSAALADAAGHGGPRRARGRRPRRSSASSTRRWPARPRPRTPRCAPRPRAARAERDYAEVAVAATGASRKLTPAELEALRADGPAGPALLADALKALRRRAADRQPRSSWRRRSRAVASAAVTWRDRL